jgi:tyrosinase
MANGVIVRMSVEGVEASPPALAALRDAYAKMQALSPSDNRSWIYWSGIHGFPNWLCWHHGRVGRGTQRPVNLFLPWHRAYLLYFEQSMRDHNSGAAIPWWDWTSATAHQIGVPASFAAPLVGTKPNALFAGPVPAIPPDTARQTRRFPRNPAALPTTQQIDALLALSSFNDFDGQLEDVHDNMHPWTGGISPSGQFGDMGTVASSAFDPIFWSHHCMIDRIWYLWQLRHGVSNIPPDYLSLPLAPFDLLVRDVLDIRALGYEYAVQTSVSAAGPAQPAA